MCKPVLFTVYHSKLRRIFNALTKDLLEEGNECFEERYERPVEFDDIMDAVHFEEILSELLEKRLLELMSDQETISLSKKDKSILGFLTDLLEDRTLPMVGIGSLKVSREYGLLLLEYET